MTEITTVFDNEKQITINSVQGECTPYEYKKRLVINQNKNPTKLSVWDFTNADLTSITSQDIKDILIFYVGLKNSPIREKVALIVPQDLHFGYGRMLSSFSEIHNAPGEFMAFKSVSEAFRWLGVNA